VLAATALERKSFQVRKVGELLGAGRNFSDTIEVAQNSGEQAVAKYMQ
jgi:hypothetical protein